MSQRLEISFQIDEEVLIAAMTGIRQALNEEDSPWEVDLLMGKLANSQNRFPVEPGYEEDDDDGR